MSETLQIFGEQFTNVTGIKAYKPNGDVVTFTAGASSPWELIKEETLAENVRVWTVDVTGLQAEYNVVIAFYTMTLSALDWVYCAFNSTSAATSGNSYTAKKNTFTEAPLLTLYNGTNFNRACGTYPDINSGKAGTSVTATNLRVNTYSASTTIRAGATVKLYGIKL